MKDAATATLYNVSYDGNGNVVKLTNASDGSIAASYEYSPFGELIESTGPYAASNPFRFSTKYHDESQFLYYGHRYQPRHRALVKPRSTRRRGVLPAIRERQEQSGDYEALRRSRGSSLSLCSQ